MLYKAVLDWDALIFKTYKEDMDWEHDKLRNMIDLLRTENSNGASKGRLLEILEKLIQFSEAHFKHEESFFLGLENYKNASSHKRVHDKILVDFDIYFERFRTSEKRISERFFQFIENRLVAHIHLCSLDRNFGEVFKAVKAQESLEAPWELYYSLAENRIQELESVLPVCGLK